MTARQPFAALLAVLAVLCGAVGGVSVYARDEVIDRPAFVERARDALDREAVRDAIATEIVARLGSNVPSALASREQLDRLVEGALRTRAFRRAFGRTAADANHVLFDDDGGSATLSLGQIAPALDAIDPRLSGLIAQQGSARLLEIRGGTLGTATPRLADVAKACATVLPPLAAVLLLAALVIASSRAAVLRVAALTAVFAGALLLVALALGGAEARDTVGISGALTRAQARDAAGAAWAVYTDDLRPWAIGAIVGGVVLTALTLPFGRARRTY